MSEITGVLTVFVVDLPTIDDEHTQRREVVLLECYDALAKRLAEAEKLLRAAQAEIRVTDPTATLFPVIDAFLLEAE